MTIKIDGVRAFWTRNGWESRNGKPLYNLPRLRSISGHPEGFEAYAHDRGQTSKERFKATIQAVRAKNKPERALGMEHLFRLDPLDGRLHMPDVTDPDVETITALLAKAMELGHEGLVLRQGSKWIKVKPEETYDVRVKGAFEGEGKHKGRLGGLITSRGKVGTGFDDDTREALWKWHKTGELPEEFSIEVLRGATSLVGQIIEVGCMGLTEAGMFRHPRFEGLRFDKDETDDLPA